jgi:2-polyprenyl-3-methyl-5-hydroxy-6-metoxy-1,4-benzoquinol methylase
MFDNILVTIMEGNSFYKGQVKSLLSPFLEKIRLEKVSKHVVGNRVLDFGCGYGKLALYIQDKRYVGVDIDQRVLESAKMLNKDRSNTDFYSFNDFENKKDKFDTVVMAAVIEHMDSPTEVLLNMKRRLDYGGRIIVTTPTPMANKILRLGSKFGLFSKEAVNEHKLLFTKKDFIHFSSDIGLKLDVYERFELGLNQIVIYSHEFL